MRPTLSLCLFLSLVLTACAATESALTPTATSLPIISTSTLPPPTPVPTERPASPTATEPPHVSTEAQTLWDKLNLQTKDQWQVANIEGWGMGFVNKETGEQIVDFPVTFSNGQGQTTVVHQLCYKSQTEGKGLMTALTCMSEQRDEHRLVKITGTDADAKEFFQWAINYPDFVNGNPQLLKAMQAAVNEGKPLILVNGELAGIPQEFIAVSGGVLKAEGKPYGSNMVDGSINAIALLPFEREDKSFVVIYEDYEASLDYSFSTNRTIKIAITSIMRHIFDFISRLTSDGSSAPMTDINKFVERGRRLVADIPSHLEQAGINVDMKVLK